MIITIARSDEGMVTQIDKFLFGYPAFESILNVAPTKIVNLSKGVAMLTFVVKERGKIHHFGTTYTAYKNALRNGNQKVEIGAIPVFPAYPAILPALCNEGVEGLLREIAQDCVATGLLTETMAIALGLTELEVLLNLELGAPKLEARPHHAGHPKLHSVIGEYDSYEIWRDMGKGYMMINVSTTPDFIDYSPLPAAGVCEVWNYKAIYRYKNQQIGNWSIVVSIAVTGNV